MVTVIKTALWRYNRLQVDTAVQGLPLQATTTPLRISIADNPSRQSMAKLMAHIWQLAASSPCLMYACLYRSVIHHCHTLSIPDIQSCKSI